MELTLEIRANKQDVEVKEYLTTGLGERLEVQEENKVSAVQVSTNAYKQTAVVELKYKHKEGEEVSQVLEVLRIMVEGEKVAEYRISTEGIVQTATSQNGYTIKVQGEKIQLQYTAENEITIECEYLDMKSISQN